MVRFWKYTKAIFKLIRIINILIIAVTMYFLRWFVVLPLFKSFGLTSQIPELYYLLIVFATMCIAGAGYVINDYFDRKADLINKPGKVILGRILSVRTGIVLHILLNIIGVGVGVYVSYSLGLLKLGIVFIFISGLLWFYSTTYKRQVLIGNLMVALMVAAVPLLILMYEVPLFMEKYKLILQTNPFALKLFLSWIGGYAIFAFLLTLIREIVKDIEDFEGDFAFGCQTIPIAWGIKTARTIVNSLIGISLLAELMLLVLYFHSLVSIIYISLAVILPSIGLLVLVMRAQTKKDYRKASNLLKLIMISGLGFVLLAYFFVF